MDSTKHNESVETLMQRHAQDPRILALRHEAALRLTRRNHSWLRQHRFAASACLLVGVGAVVYVGWSRLVPRTSYLTAVGERLAATLEDGTQITLDTDTQLRSDFSATQRIIHLAKGQGMFEVARDTRRPFVVEAAGRRITALGTAFAVRVGGPRAASSSAREGDNTLQIIVTDGSVRVDDSKTTRLNAGDTARVSGGGVAVQPRAPAELDKALSWRRGQLIFEDTRLADAIDEVNRYSATQIRLGDANLADLRISGGFATGQPGIFLEALTTYFPDIDIRQDNRAVTLTRRLPN